MPAVLVAYAVWVGIGAVLTVTYAMVTGEESASVIRVLLLVGIIGCVVGLKVLHQDPAGTLGDAGYRCCPSSQPSTCRDDPEPKPTTARVPFRALDGGGVVRP
jgi:hypothetical protein